MQLTDIRRLRKSSLRRRPSRIILRVIVGLGAIGILIYGALLVPWSELAPGRPVRDLLVSLTTIVVSGALGASAAAVGLRFEEATGRLIMMVRVVGAVGIATGGWLIYRTISQEPSALALAILGSLIAGLVGAAACPTLRIAVIGAVLATVAGAANAILVVGQSPSAVARHIVLGLWLGGLAIFAGVLSAKYYSIDPIRSGISAVRTNTADGWWLLLFVMATGSGVVLDHPELLKGTFDERTMKMGAAVGVILISTTIGVLGRRSRIKAASEAAIAYVETRSLPPGKWSPDVIAHDLRTAARGFRTLRIVTISETVVLAAAVGYGTAFGL